MERQFKDNEIFRKQFTINNEKKFEETKDGLQVTFVVSTDKVDRDGDVIQPSGIKLENYRKNPIVQLFHESDELPVAKSLREWVEGNQLKSDALFTPKELNPMGYMVGQMYKNEFMNAVSIGFMPMKYAFVQEETRPYGIDFESVDMLEYSCCNVPCNPDALVSAKSLGIDLEPLLDMAIKILDSSDSGLWIPKAENIYNTLNKSTFYSIPKEVNTYKSIPLNLLKLKTQIKEKEIRK